MESNPLNMNEAVFTTRNVVLNGALITRVYHDEDGSWQFFDSVSTNASENAMVVALNEIIKIDPSVLEVLDMQLSHYAERSDADQAWTIAEYLPGENE